MSIPKKIIAIYSNLPSGGAEQIRKISTNFLKNKAKIVEIADDNYQPKNIIEYFLTCFTKLPLAHHNLAKYISKECNILLAHHSWLTKSPHLIRYTSIPTVYFCHEPMREYYDKDHIQSQSFKEKFVNFIRLPLKYIDRKNLQNKNIKVIVNSKFSKKMVDKAYDINSSIIYPGIETQRYLPVRKNTKGNQVISVGAINRLKRYEFLIQAISHVKKKIRPKLVLIGNGKDDEYLGNLKKLALELGVDLKIRVNISRKILISEYHKSKIFLFAPINEPFGIVVVEAISSGLPIIVYKHGGGYIEKIDRNNGVIMNELNSKKWGDVITRLLEKPAKLEKYRKHNIKYASENFDEKLMNDSIWKLIKKL